MEKTKIGMPENIESAIAYSIPPLAGITGLIMLVLEPENKFVRFHAMQSFIISVALCIFTVLLKFIPFFGKPLVGIMGIAVICLWIILIFNALAGKYFKLPIIGDVIYEKIIG